jgi:hypothetical protein
MAVTPEDNPETSVGTVTFEKPDIEGFPSSPTPFAPQHFTAPPEVSAHAYDPPTATCVTPEVSPVTLTGTEELTKEEFPNCPRSLRPQHFTPLDCTAQTDFPVGETDTWATPDDIPVTAVGVKRSVLTPSPI